MTAEMMTKVAVALVLLISVVPSCTWHELVSGSSGKCPDSFAFDYVISLIMLPIHSFSA